MVWPSPLPVTKHVRHPEEIPSPGRCHSPPPPQPCSLGPAFCLHRFACWGRFTWWLLTVRGFHVWLLSLCTMCSRLAHPWQVSALQPPWLGRVCCLGTQAVASICLPSVCLSVCLILANIKYWGGCGGIQNVTHCCWQCRLGQQISSCLQKLETCLPCTHPFHTRPGEMSV